MLLLLSILFIISAILLVGIVLLQDEQGDGMGGIFGGGSGTAFGSRSGNILTRVTSILSVIFLVSAFVIGFINSTSSGEDIMEQTAKTLELEDENREDWLFSFEDDEDSNVLESEVLETPESFEETDSELVSEGENIENN